MSLQTIIFDFGNVVAFFDHGIACRALARFGPCSAEEVRRYCFGNQIEEDLETGRLSSKAFLAQIQKDLSLKASEEDLAQAFNDIFQDNPETAQILPRLKPRYRLLLGSNTSQLHADRFLPQFAGALRWFDSLILSYEVGVRKPKAGFYEAILRQSQAGAENCLFIDDYPANVEGARAVGLEAIRYLPGTLEQSLRTKGVWLD